MADDPIILQEKTVAQLEAESKATETLAEANRVLSDSSKDAARYTKELGDASKQASDKIKASTKDIADLGVTSVDATSLSKKAFELLDTATKSSSEALSGLKKSFDELSGKTADYTDLTAKQLTGMSLVSAAAIGMREQFANISGFDTEKLTTYKKEAGDLIDFFSKDIALGNTGNVLNKLSNLIGSAFNADKAKQAIASGGSDMLTTYVNNILSGADNLKRLEAIQMRLAASTGTLDEFQKSAGSSFKNLGELAATQAYQLDVLSGATGKMPHIIQQYYSELGKIPGALNETIQSTTNSAEKISSLEATIRLAEGAGRSFTDVTNDMHKAISEYGSDTEGALKFTAQITELTNKYNVQLTDVQSTLHSVANGFKFFGDQTAGASSLVNAYLGSLQGVGLSGAASLEVIQNMTNGVKNLTLAQRAYISSQTGGAGGLQGGYQIELELREGGLESVMEKVKNTLTSKMGEAVTLQEAAEDSGAAARRTKQIQMIMQGPLGQFAQNESQASVLLDSFAKNERNPELLKNLSKDPQIDLMEKGNILLDRNNNLLAQENRARQMQQNVASKEIYEFLGANTTTGDFNNVATTERGEASRNATRDSMISQRAELSNILSKVTEEMARRSAGEEVVNKAGQRFQDSTSNTIESVGVGASVIKNLGKGVIDTFLPTTDMNEEYVEQSRSNINKARMIEQASSVTSAKERYDEGSIFSNLKLPEISLENMTQESLKASAAKLVSEINNKDKDIQQFSIPSQKSNEEQTVNVVITGHCPDCFKEMHISQDTHVRAVNAATGANVKGGRK